MCGASSSEKSIQQQQQSFYSTLQNNYQQQFQGQSNILGSLTNAFTPILQAGPNQYGFSEAENAALRTQASAGTANNYQMASQATGEKLAAVGGGNEFLPSGEAGQLQAQTAQAAAQQESNQQLGITEAGYQQGNQNFNNAAQALGSTAAQYNPAGYAGQATGAGGAAFGSAQAEQQQGWGSTIGGVLGGAFDAAAGAAAGAATGGAMHK